MHAVLGPAEQRVSRSGAAKACAKTAVGGQPADAPTVISTAQEQVVRDGHAAEKHDMIDSCQWKDLTSRGIGVDDTDRVGFKVQAGAGSLDVEGVEEFSHAIFPADEG